MATMHELFDGRDTDLLGAFLNTVDEYTTLGDAFLAGLATGRETLIAGVVADLLETRMTFDEFWHAQPFGWAACDAMALARKVWDHQQAEIDELMLEFCPEQMTAAQVEEYERHQITVTP